jgi:hypothetical protein
MRSILAQSDPLADEYLVCKHLDGKATRAWCDLKMPSFAWGGETAVRPDPSAKLNGRRRTIRFSVAGLMQ